MGYGGLIDSHRFIPYAQSVGEFPACGGLQEGHPIRGDPCTRTSKTFREPDKKSVKLRHQEEGFAWTHDRRRSSSDDSIR